MIQNNVFIQLAPGSDPLNVQHVAHQQVEVDGLDDFYSHQIEDLVYPADLLQDLNYIPVPAQPTLTQAVHQKTIALLNKANDQVSTILGRTSATFQPQAYGAAPVVVPVAQAAAPAINIDLSDKSWKMFNNETQVHHHYHPVAKEEEKEKDDTGLRIVAGIIGVAAAFAAIFFAGKAIAGQEDAQDEVDSFDALKNQWTNNKVRYPVDYQLEVNTVVDRMEAIHQRDATSRTHKIALLVFTFIAGGTAFAGALAASKLLMGAGLVIGVATVAAALFKLGYSYFSKREVKDAEAIDQAIDKLAAHKLVIHP